MKKYILLPLIILTILYSQGLNTNISFAEYLRSEINSIQQGEIEEALFLFPILERQKKQNIINLAKSFTEKVHIEPILAVRWSSSGFGMFSKYTPNSVTWFTPGVKVYSTIPLFNGIGGVWIHAWSEFYKHSAIGFGGEISEVRHETFFPFNNDMNFGFVTKSVEPNNSIDFDEGQGGISLLSSNFSVTLGQFKSSQGPFYRGNLGISKHTPSFPQIRIHTKLSNKVQFTYFVGSLVSGINSNITLESIYTDQWELISIHDNNVSQMPDYQRFVINHRLDFIQHSFRIGLYEQVIMGARNIPFSYLNPLMPYWSVQHELGDTDNIQMGVDAELVHNNSRYYGALMVDEWAPFSTFDDDERNWFSYQLGMTHIIPYQKVKFIFKTEFALNDPRTYNHRFIINEPTHHGYNIGYWSGGNSEDIWVSLTALFNSNKSITMEYSKTIIGEQTIQMLKNQYENQNISSDDFNTQLIENISINTLIPIENGVNVQCKTSLINSHNIEFVSSNYFDITVSILYNIKY